MTHDAPLRVAVVVGQPDEIVPGLPESSESLYLIPVVGAEGLQDVIDNVNVVFLWEFAPGVLEAAWTRASRLRWVHAAAAGVDLVLFPAFAMSDVTLTNSKGVFDSAMAEYALALMLALAKDLPKTLRLQGEHIWAHREPQSLRGKRLVVLGVGGIGTTVGRIASAFGMRVTGVGRKSRVNVAPFDRIASVAELPDLIPQADFVMLALPLTPDTKGLYSRALLKRMRASAYLINLGRGAVADEAALIEALRAGRIAGAALDVFEVEPLPPNHPFWAMPNVIVSPHMSGDVPEVTSALVELFLSNLARFRRGEKLMNEVDKRLGFIPNGSAL